MKHFEYRKNDLFCDNVKVEDIVSAAGTPAYIYSRKAVLANFNEIKDAFAPLNPLICFSVKSNSNLSICRTLAEVGSGFDVVSGGELYRVLKIGADPSKVVFAGVGKGSEEIRYAIKNKIFMFNVESQNELENINKIAMGLKKTARVALRINPDVDPRTHAKTTTGKKENKFGIDFLAAEKILRQARKYPGIKLSGLHVHLGSPIYTTEPYVKALKKITKFLADSSQYGVKIEYINIGGGYCISYTGEKVIKPADYAKDITPLVRKMGCKLVMEPGRFIAGNAGILVTRVTYRKNSSHGKKFIICDAAMNDLIRPAIYDAYHRIWPLKSKVAYPKIESPIPHSPFSKGGDRGIIVKRGTEIVDVVGPVCESSDVFAKNRVLPKVKEGDLLAIFSAGAYGFSMSSSYNSRPRVCEIMVNGDSFSIIRKRETYKDLITAELAYLPKKANQ
ncbi:MAG: diaminopimelate decarboxylase [Candidatus Brocadiales bacterium]